MPSQESFAQGVLAMLTDPRLCVQGVRKKKGRLVGELRVATSNSFEKSS